MSSKRRQCRNHPDVFGYICREYVLEEYRFIVRNFKKSLQSLLWHKARRPRKVLGTSQGLQAMHRNVAPLDQRNS